MNVILTWNEIRRVSVDEEDLYLALLHIYKTHSGSDSTDTDEIIDWFLDNIEDWIEELIKEASPYNYSTGEIDSESITDLVTDDDFLVGFVDWYNNER